MTNEILRRIFAADAANTEVLIEKARELYGLDMSNPEEISTFLENHPDFQLPDLYLTLGESRAIFVSHHSPFYNGFSHRHDFFELIYVAEGNVTDEINGKTVNLEKGEVCIHNPNALHKIVKCNETDILINVLISKETFHDYLFFNLIRDKGLERFFETYIELGDNSASYLAFHNVADNVGGLIEMLFEEYFSEQKSEALLNATLLLLLGNLLKQYDATENNAFSSYIAEHIENISLEGAAAHFRYHPKYFSSLLKKQTGKGFQSLVSELRLKKASNLLKYTSLTIDEVALAVGYANASSFYGIFKDEYGCTPGDFRKR